MCRTARVMIHDQHKSFIVQIQKYRRVRSVSFPCCFWWSVIINPMLNWFASDDERWERHHFTNLLCFRYNSFQLVLYCLERTSQPYICVSESGRDRTWCLCSSCVPPVFLLHLKNLPTGRVLSVWARAECGPGSRIIINCRHSSLLLTPAIIHIQLSLSRLSQQSHRIDMNVDIKNSSNYNRVYISYIGSRTFLTSISSCSGL